MTQRNRRAAERPDKSPKAKPRASSARSAVADSPEDQERDAAIKARRQQREGLEQALDAIRGRFGMPGEDEVELARMEAELSLKIFEVRAEMEELEASRSMRFPGSAEVTALGTAMDRLEARIATNAAGDAIFDAATGVMDAFDL